MTGHAPTHSDAGIRRLIEEFGAEVLVTYTPPIPLSLGTMATARVKARNGCSEAGAPIWPNRLVTAPAKFAVLTATPLRGRGLVYCRGTLGSYGIYSEDVAWLSCVPMDSGETATPQLGEMRRWRDWCLDAVAAANVEYVLLMGAGAVAAWRTDVKLTGMELGKQGGGVGLWTVRGRQMIVGVTQSPYAVIRDRMLEQSWQDSLARWSNLTEERRGLDALGIRCVEGRCGESAWGYDADGVAWCYRHWRDNGGIKTTKRLYQTVVTEELEGLSA